MGLSLVNNSSTVNSSLVGTFKNLDKNTVNELNKSLKNDGQIDQKEVEAIEKAAAADGTVTEGEQALIDQLKSKTKDNNKVSSLKISGFNPTSTNTNFDLRFNGTEGFLTDPKADNPITKMRDDYRQLSSFSTGLEALPKKQKELAFKAIDFLSQKSPANLKQLNEMMKKFSPEVQNVFKQMGISNLKSDSDVQSFFASKSFKQISEFSKSFSKLTGGEQTNALNVMKILGQTPPKANFRDDIKTIMSTMPKDRGMEVGRTLNKLNIFIPATNLNAPTTEDASSRIKEVVMGAYIPNQPQSDYIRDMLMSGKSQGFKVVIQDTPGASANIIKDLQEKEGLTEADAKDIVANNLKIVASSKVGSEWAEDRQFFTVGGDIVHTPDADAEVRQARNFAQAPLINKPAADSKTGIPPYDPTEGYHTASEYGYEGDASFQGAVTGRNEYTEAVALGESLKKTAPGTKVRETKTYNEFGNLLVGTLPNGESYGVLGRDGLVISTLKLEKDNNPKLSPDKVKAQMAKMTFNPDEVKQIGARLTQAGALNGQPPEQRAKEFLAKMELSKDVFADDLGIAKENLIFVPQPDFHIDMHMRPLAPGEVMINDFDANIKLLEDAKKRAVPGSKDEKTIDAMISEQKENKKLMLPVMDAIAKKLESSGLKVVRAPGVMAGNGLKVNFMNAVPSTIPGTNNIIYKTNHTSIQPLREAYEQYMKDQKNIKVEWIGDSTGEYGLYGGTMSGAEGSLEAQGGLDCRENTIEF